MSPTAKEQVWVCLQSAPYAARVRGVCRGTVFCIFSFSWWACKGRKKNGTRRVIQHYAWWERGGKFGYQLQRSQDFDLEVQKTCMSGIIPHLSRSHGERGEEG